MCGYGYGGGCGSYGYGGGNYVASGGYNPGFILIVVLFILLIIVGASFC